MIQVSIVAGMSLVGVVMMIADTVSIEKHGETVEKRVYKKIAHGGNHER